ncbi:MAG: hypothetical protein IJQ12_06855 [Lachnospiraceae bacterium]|nr:hypothetical protein [Lachnospiraceae bacterium]
MPGTLRKATTIKALINLVNTVIFGIAFGGIALSLFFFAPGRLVGARCTVLIVSCIVLLVTSSHFSRRKRMSLRLPLLLLGLAGALFIVWGSYVVSSYVLFAKGGLTALQTGAQFALFGILTVVTASFARK